MTEGKDHNRRSFLKKLSLLLASIAGSVTVLAFLRQFSRKKNGSSSRIRIGMASDFPVGTYTYLDKHKIYVYRDHESMSAVSAICTHLGCVVKHTEDGFECPCHGSVYDMDGCVLSGPAPRALSWYEMEKMPDGKILVDLSRTREAGDNLLIS